MSFQSPASQASERFPRKRLSTLFKGFPEKVKLLLKNIFVYPPNGPFLEYQEQSDFFKKLGEIILPVGTKLIVIDNVSHHLRLATSLCSDIKRKGAMSDDLFGAQLFPLIMRCLREGITLILIHEVSFNPGSGKNEPFFNKLYSRINSLNVCMSKAFNSSVRRIEITSKDQEGGKKIPYEIKGQGIVIL